MQLSRARLMERCLGQTSAQPSAVMRKEPTSAQLNQLGSDCTKVNEKLTILLGLFHWGELSMVGRTWKAGFKMTSELKVANLAGRSVADDRVPWVDYAKGICIILVVMMHTTLNVGSRMGDAGFMDDIVAFARPFRMPDFFILSGLFLAKVIHKNWKSYADTKVVHFLYFYVLWTVIQFAFKAPIAVAKQEYDFLLPFAWSFIQPYETLWFIYILPIFFVVSKLARSVPPLVMLAGAMTESG